MIDKTSAFGDFLATPSFCFMSEEELINDDKSMEDFERYISARVYQTAKRAVDDYLDRIKDCNFEIVINVPGEEL